MSKNGLLNFMEKHPYTEKEPSEHKETEQERLKQSISEGIEKDQPAAEILKDCISLIGLLLHDQPWTEARQRKLMQNEQDRKEFEDFLG